MKTLLCVSFGTSVPSARADIRAVEDALAQTAPDYSFARAFTSPTIRRILAQAGETVSGAEEALEALAQKGAEEVLVQPTHLLYGYEYDKLRQTAEVFRDRFPVLKLGIPLLSDTDDLRQLCALLSRRYPAREDEALLLFGHGTGHFANAVYPALQTAFRMAGREDVYVGTVEGWPSLSDLLPQLAQQSRRKLHLVPIVLVAGDHVLHDMAGEKDSWVTRLRGEGYEVRCTLRGLGSLPEVQALCCSHLSKLLRS